MTPRPRWLIAALGALAVACTALGSASGSRADIATLYVAYASNCTFTLTGDTSQAVTSIAPGDYQVWVTTPEPFADGTPVAAGQQSLSDCGGAVNFQLTGPGVTFATTLDNGSNVQVVLDEEQFLPNSTYVAEDLNDPTVSAITFTTTASGTPISATVPSPKVSSSSSTSQSIVGSAITSKGTPYRGTLRGAVSAAGKLSLTFAGKSATTLLAGRYSLAVVDRSTRVAFRLQRLGHAATAVVPANARRTLSVTLTAGRWYLDSGATGTKTSLSVTAS